MINFVKKSIVYTNGIPECPYCNKPTKRVGGNSFSTCMYFPPTYDENGINTNPDRNTVTTNWKCLECEKGYSVSGNSTDGFNYS